MSRSRARRGADAALARLYASLPSLQCKGLCQRSCGPIAMSSLEVVHLEEAIGGPLPPWPTDQQAIDSGCPLLTADKRRCSQYEDRPLLCRLWGLVDDELMRCPFGCRPSRYLTPKEGHDLLRKAELISERFRKDEP